MAFQSPNNLNISQISMRMNVRSAQLESEFCKHSSIGTKSHSQTFFLRKKLYWSKDLIVFNNLTFTLASKWGLGIRCTLAYLGMDGSFFWLSTETADKYVTQCDTSLNFFTNYKSTIMGLSRRDPFLPSATKPKYIHC